MSNNWAWSAVDSAYLGELWDTRGADSAHSSAPGEISRSLWIIQQLIAALQQPSAAACPAAVLRSPHSSPKSEIFLSSIHFHPPILPSPLPSLSPPRNKKPSIFNIRTEMICVYRQGLSPVVITIERGPAEARACWGGKRVEQAFNDF